MHKEVKIIIIIKKTEKEGELTHFQLNPRTYTQIYTPTNPPPPHRPTVVGEGLTEPFPGDLICFAVFQNDFAFSGKPFSSQHDEVYFMGGGAAGGL